MQQYPVEFSHDKRDGSTSIGLASTAADALQLFNECSDTPATESTLEQVQVGPFATYDTAKGWAIQQVGASEPFQVWGGWAVHVETWNCH